MPDRPQPPPENDHWRAVCVERRPYRSGRGRRKRTPTRGTSLAADSVVLTADEASELSDRVYQVRCAAEDVATAIEEGAEQAELRELCNALMKAAKAADGWR